MMKSVHNWIAVVAVLAVTLLGAIAINRTSSERVNTLRESVVNVCQNQNIVRQQYNADSQRVSRNIAVLRLALIIAAREEGQTNRDAEEYQHLVTVLGPVVITQAMPLLDCSNEVPKQ